MGHIFEETAMDSLMIPDYNLWKGHFLNESRLWMKKNR